MKRSIFSVALVFVLILSLTVVAYADTGPYSYTVSSTGRYTESEPVAHTPVYHTQGDGTDFVPYTTTAKSYYFDFNQFDSAYRVGLEQEYLNVGFWRSLSIPVRSKSVYIPASAETGLYSAEVVVTFAKGVWSVNYGGSTIRNGSFTASPVTYDVKAVK